MPLLTSSLQRGQMPTKNYLVRQICMKAWTLHISVHDDLRKFDGWTVAETAQESKLSIKTTEHFGKSALEVFSTVKRKGRHCYLSYFETWGTVKIFCKLTSNLSNYLKSKNFTMKGTMLLGVTLVYKFVVQCYKTLSLWDYPWLFGFLLYL